MFYNRFGSIHEAEKHARIDGRQALSEIFGDCIARAKFPQEVRTRQAG